MQNSDYNVSLCKLSDGKISVRLNDNEVAILPKKNGCSLEAIEDAINTVVDAVIEKIPEVEEESW